MNENYNVVHKAPPNHTLHLILTLLTCGWWSNVWLVLTARYWGVRNHLDQGERDGMNRRTALAIVALVVAYSVLGFLLVALIAAGSTTT